MQILSDSKVQHIWNHIQGLSIGLRRILRPHYCCINTARPGHLTVLGPLSYSSTDMLQTLIGVPNGSMNMQLTLVHICQLLLGSNLLPIRVRWQNYQATFVFAPAVKCQYVLLPQNCIGTKSVMQGSEAWPSSWTDSHMLVSIASVSDNKMHQHAGHCARQHRMMLVAA